MSVYTIDTSKDIPYLTVGVSFTIAASGKKSHVASITALGEIDPLCGSGSNIAGRTLRRRSSFKLSNDLTILGDNLCSKCIKNQYVKRVQE
jgi:hypothetical protein